MHHAGQIDDAVHLAVMVLADGLFVWLGATAWHGHRNGMLTAEQAGPFAVMGVSAAVGALLALLAMIALLRGRRGHGLARGALHLTWLRLGAVLVALVVVALTVGGTTALSSSISRSCSRVPAPSGSGLATWKTMVRCWLG